MWAAAKHVFEKVMRHNGVPETVTMDKSGANKAALDEINSGQEIPAAALQTKYLNNVIEQIIVQRSASLGLCLALNRFIPLVVF
jgi:transposase-like protein